MAGAGYLLIDYASFRPDDLDAFDSADWQVKMFVGTSEQDLEVAKVSVLQRFGAGLEYLRVDGGGPAAVDLHMAFCLGRLAAASQQVTFWVLPAGRAFDTLLRHLDRQGIDCRRLRYAIALADAKFH